MDRPDINSTRSAYWDNIKGILICLVVFAHFMFDIKGQIVIDLILFVIYVFHMPAFVFVSGYFTHDHSKVRKLVNAFLIFQPAYLICYFFRRGSLDILSPAHICWYLVALIVWRLAAKHIPKKKYILPVLFAVSLLTGFIGGIGNKFSLTRILAFAVFFFAGYLSNNGAADKLRKHVKWYMGVQLLILSVIASLFANVYLSFTMDDLTMMEYASRDRLIARAVILLLAGLFTFSLLVTVPDRKCVLSRIGKNTLPIYLMHRFVTFIFADIVGKDANEWIIIAGSLVMTVITVACFGNDRVAAFTDRLLGGDDGGYRLMRRIVTVPLVLFVTAAFVITSTVDLNERNAVLQTASPAPAANTSQDLMFPCMTGAQQQRLDNCTKIVFAGDLILLEDQVRLAYDEDTDSYDFSPLFEYTADEISSADLAIGVYEGPSGGEEIGYSTGNFADGKTLSLNFPDEFAAAVADAGFDIVTTANNHLLDRGTDAALRTCQVLDDAGLMRIGTYSDASDKENGRVRIIEVSGMRIAVLAYTYGCNGHTDEEFFDGEYQSLTSVIAAPGSTYYEQSLQQVREDFEYCRSLSPDIIIVLPHMGTQFADEADEFQTTWRQNFIDLGADIILGDHTHSVQPAFMEEAGGRMTFTAYCPGNYTNIYREHNGDASMLVEIYIDNGTHEIVAGGIVPMWTTAPADGNYRPIPVWDAVNDEEVRSQLTVYDLERIEEVMRHITGTVLGTPFGTDLIEPQLIFDADGFIRHRREPLEVTSEMMQSPFYDAYVNAGSVCFIGDSITAGSRNGGIPWYEPIEGLTPAEITDLCYGGWTSVNVVRHIDDAPAAEMYVVAIGTNDVRYDDDSLVAVTPEAYAENLETIRSSLRRISPDCSIWFIAPWISYDGDRASPRPYDEINSRRAEYSAALEEFCARNGENYIDPNGYILDVISHSSQASYIVDWIHPNSRAGVYLYSEAVILSSGPAA